MLNPSQNLSRSQTEISLDVVIFISYSDKYPHMSPAPAHSSVEEEGGEGGEE